MKTLESFDKAREYLEEAKRYPNTLAARELISDAIHLIDRVCPADTGERLILNITVAAGASTVDPGAFRGYIDGVRHELAVLRGRAEKEGLS